MKQLIPLICTVLLIVLPTPYFAADTLRPITVTIDYGEARETRTIATTYRPGTTALELLRQVANVRSYKLGEYTFVRSVDGLEGKRGEMGWFYSVDGISAKTVAGKRPITDAKRMTWRYKAAACY